MSLPNSVGIEPNNASGRSFSASGRLVYQKGETSERVLTAQLVLREIKVRQVEKLAEFRGDQPCQQRKVQGFVSSGTLVY